MNGRKIALIVGIVVVLLVIVGFTVQQSQKNVVSVQTAKVGASDLTSTVTGSGQIKPKTYVNIGANAFGKIIKLYVHEGDKVKRGQTLAQLENVQSSADVAANQAATQAARTDALAASAALNTSTADLKRAQSDLERTRLDYDRAQELFKAQLIPKSEFDTRKAAYDSAVAGMAQADARIAQARAQKDSAERRITQASATLTRASDVLSKTVYAAPFDGVVTSLPVREGETVVMGIQNSPGSVLMSLADMSVITAEVMVDETDIINIKLNQPAEVTVDALPKQVFKGHVSEIGDNAVVRSTGIATSQTTGNNQEAKDFKVVVTLDNPPDNLRPGLSSTAKIITASKPAVLSIPIQALTVRNKSELEEKPKGGKPSAPAATSPAKKAADELQGVFVVNSSRKAQFRPVETGITGTTDIEVVNGLKPGEEIITGSYRVLRTLKNGSSVKVDNSVAKKEDEKS
jgi:HlyD family secretion protein